MARHYRPRHRSEPLIEHCNPLELLTDHYATLRRYSPVLLEMFEFKAAPAAAELLHAAATESGCGP